MNVLKLSRGHLKGAITCAHTFILDIEVVDIDILETRLDRLEEAWKGFCLNQNEIFQYSDEEGYVDPEIDFEATETKYLVAKSAFLKAIRKNTPVVPSPPPSRNVNNSSDSTDEQSNQQAALLETLLNNSSFASASKMCSEIDLPKFKIPAFGGDYREWPEFRDMFLGSIDCKPKLSGAQKMRYLKSFLEDDAAKLLMGIEIADANYLQAWEKLECRYNKPLYIANAYIESFLKMPSVTVADSGHLRRLVNKLDEVVPGLKALKTEGRDPWLIYLLLNKTDLETRKAWSLHKHNCEASTIIELLEFLEQRCDALEASSPKTIEAKNRGTKNHARSGGVFGNIKSFSVTNPLCIMCKEHHTLPQCPKFISLSVPSRRSYARDQ